ncbi:MAG TPA: cohesin domain-containing protein [Anaerolineae bacterium]|nr:cohesin domain-containing protein [Anaerolineae bacterium]
MFNQTTKNTVTCSATGLLATSLRIAVLVFMLLPVSIASGASVLLRPDPQALGLKPGEQATLSIRVENAQDLYAWEIHLTFDPAIVEVADADASEPGIQIASGDAPKDSFVAVNQADNTLGQIDYALTLLNPAPPVSGNATLAIIQFKARNNGDSSLKLREGILATRDAQPIVFEWQEGALAVSETGEAPQPGQSASGANTLPDGQPAASETKTTNSNLTLIAAAGMGAVTFVAALITLVIVLRRKR